MGSDSFLSCFIWYMLRTVTTLMSWLDFAVQSVSLSILNDQWDHMYWKHLRLSVDQYPWSTLNRHCINISVDISIDTWSTLDQHSIDVLIDTWLTLDQQLIDCWQSVDRLICIEWHLMACLWKLVGSQPTVDWDIDWVLTRYRSRCWLSVDHDVNGVLIEIRLRVDWGYWLTLDHRCL